MPHLGDIEKWLKDGATDKAVADKLHIGISTLRLWLQRAREGEERYKALLDTFTRGRVEADAAVENALWRSACGYTVKVQKVVKVKVPIYDNNGKKTGEREELKTAYEEQHVPANVIAQQFWLCNRRKSKWAYKPEAASEDADKGGGIVYMPDVMTPPGKTPEADKTEAKA